MRVLIERTNNDPVLIFPETGAKVMLIESIESEYECDVATFAPGSGRAPCIIIASGTREVCADIVRVMGEREYIILSNKQDENNDAP